MSNYPRHWAMCNSTWFYTLFSSVFSLWSVAIILWWKFVRSPSCHNAVAATTLWLAASLASEASCTGGPPPPPSSGPVVRRRDVKNRRHLLYVVSYLETGINFHFCSCVFATFKEVGTRVFSKNIMLMLSEWRARVKSHGKHPM